ncbi:MAG: oligosaccharide flippase family protein [Planctomycetes bacterium]|nr:oligosaccharide flippase family protein [Planctomycetota bacterium]
MAEPEQPPSVIMLVKEYAGLILLRGSGRALSLILIPILTSTLSVADFGVFTILNVLALLFGFIFPFGANVLFANEYVKEADPSRRRKILSTMYFFSIISSIVFLALGLLFSEKLSLVIFGEAGKADLIRILMLLMFFQGALTIGRFYLQFTNRIRFNAFLELIHSIILFGFILGGLYLFTDNVRGLMWAHAAAYLLPAVWYLAFMQKDLTLKVSKKYSGEILRLGPPTVLHNIAHWGLASLDLLLLQKLSSEQEVGLYGFAYRFGFFMNILVYGFSVCWTPYFTRLFASGLTEARMKKTLSPLGLLAIGFLSFTALALALFSREIVALLAPVEYAAAVRAVPWILLGYLFLALYYTTVPAAMYHKLHRYLPIATGGALALNAILNWIYIPAYGMLAAAVTTAVSYALLYLLAFLITARCGARLLPWGKSLGTVLLCLAVYLGFVLVENHYPDYLASPAGMFCRLGFLMVVASSGALWLLRRFQRQRVKHAD